MIFLLAMTTIAQTPSSAIRNIPSCQTVKGSKLVGAGKYGLHFAVPKGRYKVSGGPDVDYAKYVVRPNDRSAVVELWFGGNTLAITPEPMKVLSSTNLSQTKLITEDRPGMGKDMRSSGNDSRGFSSGRYWRHFGIQYAGGAVYDTKDETDAHLLDVVVDSACFTPFPRN